MQLPKNQELSRFDNVYQFLNELWKQISMDFTRSMSPTIDQWYDLDNIALL